MSKRRPPQKAAADLTLFTGENRGRLMMKRADVNDPD